MHGSAPWKTEETIVGLPRLLVLSVFSRFGGCHLSRFGPMSAIGRAGTFSYTTDVPGATLTSMIMKHWGPFTFPRYQRVGGPFRSLPLPRRKAGRVCMQARLRNAPTFDYAPVQFLGRTTLL